MARSVKLSLFIMNLLVSALALLSAAYAIVVVVAIVRSIRAVPILEHLAPSNPTKWPRVSVVVAACNEEESIESAMRSRLAEGYPNVEYILVDDRSSDRTGEIIDQLAAEDDRVRAVHVTKLPEGWLGKVHAMQRGLDHATGEWILFSDADVHHEPGALAKIVAQCEESKLDHVTVFPEVWSSGFAVDVVMNAIFRVFTAGARVWKVNDPKSRQALGGGNFNLVRRESLDRAGGLDTVKLEVVDDVTLAQRIKWAGARQGVFNARGLVSLYFYRSIGEVVRGMEKNAFAVVGRYNVPRFVAAVLALMLAELGSIVAVFGASAWSWQCMLGLTTIIVAMIGNAIVARWLRRPVLPSIFAPIGLSVMFFGAIRSMVLTLARGGVEWRGTRYPLDQLRREMRFEHT